MAVRSQPSAMATHAQAIIGFALLLLAQYTVRPLIGGRAPIDFLAIAVLFSALVGYGASWLKAVFFADHIALTGLFVFVGKWVYDGVYNFAGPRLGGVDLVVQLLLWTPLAAALTALVAVLLLTVFRPLYRPYTK